MSPNESDETLVAAIGPHEHTRLLASGEVDVPGRAITVREMSPIIAAFRQMVRHLEYDICELAPTTYLVAREAGVPIVALPVFLTREFHFTNVVCGEDSNIHTPTDLHGRRVGVRAYTVSTGVWVRSLLSTQYGVDPNSITWVVDDEEHVNEFELPGNVVQAPAGTSLADLFATGDIDAAFTGPAGIGRSGPPREGWDASTSGPPDRGYYPLFENTTALERSYFESTGIYPLHGLVAVKSDVIQRDPALGELLVSAFQEAKQPLLEQLRTDAPGNGRDIAHYAEMAAIVGDDPLPYGVAANLPSIEALIAAAVEQRILRTRPSIEELFVG